jgi:hypothetical protein
MADVSGITAVRPGSQATQVRLVQYGATIAAGNSVYPLGSEMLLADANASDATAAAAGVAITPGVDNGWGLMAFGGPIILVGATLVVGMTYVVSDTAGGIMPITDLSTGERCTILGTASTTTQLNLAINATGITRA